MANPTISLVTGKLERDSEFDRLVNSIIQCTAVEWELVVSDASEKTYVSSVPNIRILEERPRKGHVGGFNAAFKECRGDYVVWLNDDAEVLSGYDETAIQFMRLHGGVGLGVYYYYEAPQKHFHVNMCFNMIFANFGIIPRKLGDEIGWFDSDLYMYGSDNSLTFRVLMAGYGVATIPGAFIKHHSVMDATRIANEPYRMKDGPILNRKYAPHRQQMMETYKRYKHLVGPRIYPNGTR